MEQNVQNSLPPWSRPYHCAFNLRQPRRSREVGQRSWYRGRKRPGAPCCGPAPAPPDWCFLLNNVAILSWEETSIVPMGTFGQEVSTVSCEQLAMSTQTLTCWWAPLIGEGAGSGCTCAVFSFPQLAEISVDRHFSPVKPLLEYAHSSNTASLYLLTYFGGSFWEHGQAASFCNIYFTFCSCSICGASCISQVVVVVFFF